MSDLEIIGEEIVGQGVRRVFPLSGNRSQENAFSFTFKIIFTDYGKRV